MSVSSARISRSKYVRIVFNMFIPNNSIRSRRAISRSTRLEFTRNISVLKIENCDVKSTHKENLNNDKAPIKHNFLHKVNCNLKKFIRHFGYYCQNSTLHGLKYVGDVSLTFGERLFWLISCVMALCFSIFFIASLYDKFDRNPVIISFSPTTVPLSVIPFPAITICNVNIAIKNKAERIYKEGSEVERRLLSDYCNSNNSFSNETEDDEKTANWKTVRAFLIDISESCEDMIRNCVWELREFDCKFYVNAILTDEGYCCSFNRLPSNYSLRNAKMMNGLNETYQSDIIDWNLETGYPSKAPNKALPRRVSGSGAHLGLQLVLDSRLDNYYCTSTNSMGFKVLLSSPNEMPRVQDYGFFINPGFEFRIVVRPRLKDAIKSVDSIHVNKRKCFFARERYLQFYRIYTEKNCHLECQTNNTLKKCGCVPYYLPLNLTTRICGKQQETCVDEAKYEVETGKLRTDCNCLPGCFEITYGKSISMAKLSKTTVKAHMVNHRSLDYFVKNMAVLHVFFEEDNFVKQTKSELYGFSEFLSNTGGLLGLFLGFSFLSAIELGYYVILRVSCNALKMRRHQSAQDNFIPTYSINTYNPIQPYFN